MSSEFQEFDFIRMSVIRVQERRVELEVRVEYKVNT
jgi:hypothetical protein